MNGDTATIEFDADPTIRAGLARGDARTWEQAYMLLHGRVYGYALKLSADEQQAYDIAQEAFTRTLARARNGYLPDRLAPYLFTAARNLYLKQLERQKTAGPAGSEDAATRVIDTSIDAAPETTVLLGEQRGDVQAALATIPDRQREVLALCDMEGCSYAQAGELLGMNENSVAQLLFRARNSLRLQLRLQQVDPARLPADCDANPALISKLLDGQLKGDAREALEQHLEGCASCRQVMEDFRLAQHKYRGFLPPIWWNPEEAWASLSAEHALTDAPGVEADAGETAVLDTGQQRAREQDTPAREDWGRVSPHSSQHAISTRVLVVSGALLCALAVAALLLVRQDDGGALDPAAREGGATIAGEDATQAEQDRQPTDAMQLPTGEVAPDPEAQVETSAPDPTTPSDEPPPPPPPATEPPDLTVDEVSLEGSNLVVANGSNSGGESAPASVTITYGDQSQTVDAGSAEPGGTWSARATFSCAEGTFTISATVDAEGAVTEANEANNTTSQQVSSVC